MVSTTWMGYWPNLVGSLYHVSYQFHDYAIKKGRNSSHQFTKFLGINGYPTIIFISESGDLITPVVGYQNPQQLELYLKMIKQGDYMVFSKPDDFEKYRKNFIPKFKN